MEDFILTYEPDYWIHGHVHAPNRYFIGKTGIICNPHVYNDEHFNGLLKN